jgi:peptidoglycan/LPS O-acetylase OafA/YrhL
MTSPTTLNNKHGVLPERPVGGDVPIARAPRYLRIPALDFTKGALVLIMVLYHWLNYFISPQGFIYRYLRFLTPSFIFISGFLISHVYFVTYGISDPQVPRRLMKRGLKILAVFIFLNVVRIFLIPDSRNGVMPSEPWAAKNIIAVYVTGNMSVGGVKAAAFPILVPISYLLLLSAGLVIICRFYKYTFHAVCLFALLCILILDVNGMGSGNLELLTIGLLGVILGFKPIETIDNLVVHRGAVVAAYLCYVAAISIWNVIYPIQFVGVCLNLLVIYALGANSEQGRVSRHIVLLGKYSLFGYIAQIAILQALYRSLRFIDPGIAKLVISFFAAFALTIISVEVLDRTRRRAVTVDRLYKAIFA